MMRFPASFLRVIAFLSSFYLIAIAGKDGRVYVQGEMVKMEVIEYPLIKILAYCKVRYLIKFGKISFEYVLSRQVQGLNGSVRCA